MSKRPVLRVKALLALIGSGALVFQIGNCTSDQVKAQMSAGVSTTILNILGLGTRSLTDEIFDVDD
ncbi:MAG: hypothetical protein IID40_01105 [Planctomycetes bacterium]|nr:hypothetical protein [Planctomycetota bacterium]